MSELFRAFSFVDKIHDDETGKRISGEYHVPETVEEFPLSLVAESVGQLAAWSSIAAVDFRFRPVAGIAGEVEFCGEVRPGATLQLEASISKADAESVNYDGVARVDGNAVVRLKDCLGPMIPIEEFDDPSSLRERYGLLTGFGAKPDAFEGVPEFSWDKTGGDPGQTAEATFRVPESAPFFEDHFPRKPVFPGTLLMNLNLRFALDLASESSGGAGAWKPLRMTDVKLRSFLEPGDRLDLAARVEESGEDTAKIVVEARKGKRLVGSARVLLSRKD
ncbi:MAG: hypothetical protein WD342_20380 [Verrucomicrobiales bacterium]